MAGGAAATSEGSAASAAALQWTVPEPEMSKLKSRRPRAVPSTSPPSKVQVPSTAARAPKPMDSAEVIRSLQVWQKAVSYVDGWVQKYPDWMQDTVAPAMMAILVLMVVRDAAYNSLGSSNGKFISFVDTCLSVMSYRDGLPNKKGKYFVGGDGQAAFGFRVVTGSFCMKFASGIAVSALIGKTPVVFKSIRHSLFVALGLVLLWLTPGDYAYTMMKKSHALRLVLLAGGGLYKLRKAVYAIEVIIESGGGFSLALASVVLAVDGNTLTRRALLWLECALQEGTSLQTRAAGDALETDACAQAPGSAKANGLAVQFCLDGAQGLWRFLLFTLLPLGVVAGLLWTATCKAVLESAGGDFSEDACLELRIFLLGFFMFRAGVFKELSWMHTQSMAAELTLMHRTLS